MKQIIKPFLVSTALLAAPAFSADIIMHQGSTITVPVNTDVGSIVEFPAPVQMSVPSKQFKINRITTNVDKKTRKPVNIRFFSIRPSSSKSTDNVTFVFPNMRSVKVRFIAQSGADKHHLLRFPRRDGGSLWSGQVFLGDEVSMMVTMLRDEEKNGFDRQKLHQDLRLSGVDGIDLTLVRRFQGKGLLGYVFKMVNTDDTKIHVNPAALNFGSPNQAVLFQIDHETLEPCNVNNSSDPKLNSCMAVVRLVVRGSHYVMPSSSKDLPFRVKRG